LQLSQIDFGSNLKPSFSNSAATIFTTWFLQGKKRRDEKAAKTGVATKEEEDEEQTDNGICLR
jgi:hypothetical protein